jgi:hypothetical protein
MKRILLAGLLVLMCGVANAAQWQNAGTAQLPGTINVSDIDYNTQNYVTGPLDRLLAGYRSGLVLTYSSASELTVTAGEVMVANEDASVRLMLRNTTSTTIVWGNIDTGSEAGSTLYYIYAIAATTASETATFKISADSAKPSGYAGFGGYAKIGSFYNDASSNITKIMPSNIYPATVINTGTIANGATIALPDGYVNDQCNCFVSINTYTQTACYQNNISLSVNSSRVVTADDIFGCNPDATVTANYIIICTK